MALGVAGASAAPHSRAVSCPLSVLPLTTNSISPAWQAAFAREKHSSQPQVTGAISAPTDVQRGAMAKAECGLASGGARLSSTSLSALSFPARACRNG